MTSWVVRAGKEGEEESKALALGVITIGWNELPDLSKIDNKAALESMLREYYPNYSKYKIANLITQVWFFLRKIKKNDFVAIPLKTKNSDMVSLGVVESQELTNF